MTGKGEYFPGLIPLVQAYLHHINCDDVAFEGITKYLDFIQKQATGKLMTPVTWLCKFCAKSLCRISRNCICFNSCMQ